MEEEGTNLKDEIKRTNQLLEQLVSSGKVKGVKLAKVPSKAQVSKGFIYVLYIRENGVIDPMKVQVEELTTFIEKNPRFVMPQYLLSYKGRPAIIQPSWSIEPFSPYESFEESTRLNTIASGRKLIINRLESGEIKAKKKMSGALILGIIVAVIIAGYFLLFN